MYPPRTGAPGGVPAGELLITDCEAPFHRPGCLIDLLHHRVAAASPSQPADCQTAPGLCLRAQPAVGTNTHLEEGKRERGLGEAWGKDGRRAESKHQEKAGRTLLPWRQHLALGGLHSRMQVAGDLVGPTVNEQTGVLPTNLPENIRGPSGNLGSKSLWTPSEMGREEALPSWLLGSGGCLAPLPSSSQASAWPDPSPGITASTGLWVPAPSHASSLLPLCGHSHEAGYSRARDGRHGPPRRHCLFPAAFHDLLDSQFLTHLTWQHFCGIL